MKVDKAPTMQNIYLGILFIKKQGGYARKSRKHLSLTVLGRSMEEGTILYCCLVTGTTMVGHWLL